MNTPTRIALFSAVILIAVVLAFEILVTAASLMDQGGEITPGLEKEATRLRQENSRLAQENTQFRQAAFQGLVQGHVQAIWCESNRFTVVWPQTPTQP